MSAFVPPIARAAGTPAGRAGAHGRCVERSRRSGRVGPGFAVDRARALTSGVLVALGVGGCAGGAPPLPPLPQLPALGAANEPTRADASSTEVYRRIAAGAVACWFSPQGALARTHMFHADADPAARGGIVEVYVHERDRTGPQPWGTKVFRIALAPVGEQTTIDVRNLKLPEPLAAQMRTDVFQWAVDGPSCKAGDGGTGFNIEEPAPPPKPKGKVRPKAKAKALE